MEICFVWNRSPERLAAVPAALRLDDLSAFTSRTPDLIVELAHPAITRDFGARFLTIADYLPLSVSALVDSELEARLLETAQAHGTRLLIPHGALIGVDNLVEGGAAWREVSITFEKHPDSIDFSDSGLDPADIRDRRVIFDGTAREVGRLFPRNVNTMVTCALATVGLDRCRARLIADPALDVGVAEVEAVGRDGSRLFSRKQQPMAGVSGTEMLESLYSSVRRAAGAYQPLEFV
jgi:predicted dinucleotide-utilizing enzyme